MIKDAYEIFDGVIAPEIKDVAIHNGTESLLLEVSGATGIDIDVQGKVDLKRNNFTTLSIIDMSNLTVVSAITAPGNYIVSVTGMSYVKISLNAIADGALTVFGRGLQ